MSEYESWILKKEKQILFGQFGLLKICWKHFTKWLNWKTTQIPTS
jgi:hypothetical protein